MLDMLLDGVAGSVRFLTSGRLTVRDLYEELGRLARREARRATDGTFVTHAATVPGSIPNRIPPVQIMLERFVSERRRVRRSGLNAWDDELLAMADKIWREAISHRAWGTPSQALDAAHAALTGHTPLVARTQPMGSRVDRIVRSPVAREAVELATSPPFTAVRRALPETGTRSLSTRMIVSGKLS